MVVYAAAGILLAFVIVAVLVVRNPEAAEKWYGRYKMVQGFVWGTFFAIVGGVLLASGQPLLMLSGLFIWGAIAAAVIIDGPLWGVIAE